MLGEIQEVLDGRRSWWLSQADVVDYLARLPRDSVDLVLGSPPYEDSRSYDMDFNRKGEDWVAWMVEVFWLATRACRGLVCMVVGGRTKDYQWSAVPMLLAADLHRQGFNLRRPVIFQRSGIAGSGGPDWLRSDWDLCLCVTPPGQLPWSDNTACGQPPKYGPGGEMSHRLQDGRRVNAPNGYEEGDTRHDRIYVPPALANPGDVFWAPVGGGRMGSRLCHENEAPYPEALCDFFIRSFCRPGGIVVDPFSGSGTTGAVALRGGRRYLGADLRASQVKLSRRRIEEVLSCSPTSSSAGE